MLKEIKYVTAEEAVKVVKSGDHIHLSSVASAPKILIDALCARGEAGELKNVRIHHLHTEGPAPYADPKFDGVFFQNKFDFDVTFYQNTMSNQYLNITTASGQSKPINSGKVRNRGVEFTGNYHMKFGKDFRWTTGINLAYNDNKILETY